MESAQTVVGRWEGRSPDLWAALDFEDFVVVGVHILSVVFAIAEPLGCRYDFYGSATLIDGLTFSFHYNQG